MDIAEIFGMRITALRNESGMSREELSKKINLSESKITKLESGQRLPTIPEVVIFGKFYNVSYDYLLGESENRISQEFIDLAGGDEGLASSIQRLCSLPEDVAETVLQQLSEMAQSLREKATDDNETKLLEK